MSTLNWQKDTTVDFQAYTAELFHCNITDSKSIDLGYLIEVDEQYNYDLYFDYREEPCKLGRYSNLKSAQDYAETHSKTLFRVSA